MFHACRQTPPFLAKSVSPRRQTPPAREALERRVAQLTMDYIYQAVVLLRSPADLSLHVERLKACGLYPLPVRRYTLKYFLFAFLANARAGLCLLSRLLPLAKPEE